jgi:hypothetical protein
MGTQQTAAMEADRYTSFQFYFAYELVFLTNTMVLDCCRGLPKKRLKKASIANTETSIVVATGMVFPPNEAVEKVVPKKRKRKASAGPAKSNEVATTSATSMSNRYDNQICSNKFDMHIS